MRIIIEKNLETNDTQSELRALPLPSDFNGLLQLLYDIDALNKDADAIAQRFAIESEQVLPTIHLALSSRLYNSLALLPIKLALDQCIVSKKSWNEIFIFLKQETEKYRHNGL